ncbi:hypothetical protein FOZG_09314 [Fusarium oxysporum Fo47]|uniref:C2H2-type domain-containing protein n=1 Tax=Fusarium oxysporum Fo47 TaxID=660027 RepID=W9K8F5_FUSOX|nr:hypothetical protein FOZG_09314 [Fusarium oxysporum Fo47]EWZ40672.1 hypothetical protein FOZG_09314 [Fusarium oxysporum Fo47]
MGDNNHIGEAGLHHLPLRMRDAPLSKFPSLNQRNGKKVPESLHFTPGAFRLRSPTESSMSSSISSANVPDSATTHSLSTLASPISTTYASSIQEQFAAATLDGSRPASRICHRHNPSSGTCSTFVNEDDDAIITGYPEFDIKIRNLNEAHRRPVVQEVKPESPGTESFVKEERVLTPTTESHHTDDVFNDDEDDSEDVSQEDANSVLNYALQVIYGVDLNDVSIPQDKVQSLVSNFTQDIGQHIWQSASDGQLSHTMSTSSSSSTPSQDANGDRRGGKRKKQGRREDDGDEFSDGEGSGYLPTKRSRPNPKEDENLRLSCPFRKRNPHRFNVRDHHSCAMTYFPKFAELRQHIVKQHKRDDPSAFVCDRCSRDFPTRKELRDHQRLPKEYMCDIADADAESGIDPQTATKLLSRKRASGTSPEVQWKEIWNIVFPDDDDSDVRPYEYTPVIEHFEVEAKYREAFDQLKYSLLDKISNPATLETLSTKFYQCFIETLDQCIANAQSMPYTNRSNKKNDIIRSQVTQSIRKPRGIMPRPDSGVVMDDGSEESGSVMLGHRDSVRTVRTSLRGSQVPETVNEVIPAAGFEELMQPMLGMDGTDVQAWNNGVMYPQMMPDQLIPTGGMTPQTEYVNWGQIYPGFDTLGNGVNGFTGFNGQQ